MKLLISSLLAITLFAPDSAPPQGSPGAEQPAAARAGPVMRVTEGISTPESVLYDYENDVYLVSNINGSATAKDNNGYIAVLTPDGAPAPVRRLVEGGKRRAVLNAPKGMALAGGVLYVADIDTVRMFDRNTGAPKGALPVPGATFLNDVAASPDGKTVYVSDSGMRQGEQDFEPTGTDAIYAINGRKLSVLLKAKDLGRPNGLAATSDTLWVTNFGNDELWAIDLKRADGVRKKGPVFRLPKGGLDGLVLLPNQEVLVSSWEAGAVFRGKPGGEFKQLLTDVAGAADIGYDSRRNRVLVPRFTEDRVEAWQIQPAAVR